MICTVNVVRINNILDLPTSIHKHYLNYLHSYDLIRYNRVNKQCASLTPYQAHLIFKKKKSAYLNLEKIFQDFSKRQSRIISIQFLQVTTITNREINSFENLPTLKALSLIASPLPRFINTDQLHQVTTLVLSRMYIKEQDLNSLGQLTQIEHLDLSYPQATNKGISFIRKILTLTTLNISGNAHLSDDCLGYLKNLNRLSTLYLKGIKAITGRGFIHFAKLPLTHLDLYYTLIGRTQLYHLTHLPLRRLNLALTYTTGLALSYLNSLALTDLNLASTHIEDADLVQLKNLPLTRLNLSAVLNISDKGLKHLEDLALRRCNLKYNPAISQHAQSIMHLRTVFNSLPSQNAIGANQKNLVKTSILLIEEYMPSTWHMRVTRLLSRLNLRKLSLS